MNEEKSASIETSESYYSSASMSEWEQEIEWSRFDVSWNRINPFHPETRTDGVKQKCNAQQLKMIQQRWNDPMAIDVPVSKRIYMGKYIGEMHTSVNVLHRNWHFDSFNFVR